MRVLMFDKSYGRLKDRIEAAGVSFEPLLIDAEGKITLDGVPVEDPHPDAAWANEEVFRTAAAREFMVALLKSPDLKWVQSAAAGFDHPVFGQLVQKGARLSTSHGQALGMAEYVLWGVIDHFQNGPARRAAQTEGVWRRHPFREILDSRWLIVGFGSIGQAVAQRAKGFGAHITGVRRNQGAHPLADRIAPLANLPALLPDADVVVLSAPLTPETKGLVNAGFLGAMKDRSVIVNVGRGGLVDEAALKAALDAGKPEHAVLDVFETEPLPDDTWFWTHPRVTLTPHASGITTGQGTRNDTLFVENLRRFLSGEPVLNEADPKDVLGN